MQDFAKESNILQEPVSFSPIIGDRGAMCRYAPSVAKDSLGKKIKEARIARGLSVAELAKKSGVDPSSIYRIEEGAKPQAATYRKLAKVLASVKPLPDF